MAKNNSFTVSDWQLRAFEADVKYYISMLKMSNCSDFDFGGALALKSILKLFDFNPALYDELESAINASCAIAEGIEKIKEEVLL